MNAEMEIEELLGELIQRQEDYGNCMNRLALALGILREQGLLDEYNEKLKELKR